MKIHQRRNIQIATMLLALIFTVGILCGCLSEPIQESSTMALSVTDITDQVNSLSNEFALTSDEVSALSEDDLCWVIVRFNDDSILDTAMRTDANDIYNYINSSLALTQAASINKAQDKFAKKYSSVICDTSFRYNALFNGMAVQVRYGDIAKLEKDSSVSDVIVCERYNAPQAVTQNEVNVYSTGIYDPGDVGYDGTGTVVAVLDTGLDYTHTAFAEQPTGTLAMDIDKVRGLLSSFTATEMSALAGTELTADALYVSDKIPFAFDYADVDADVYPTSDHGTHVAGIIAGHDDVITGIATNAQLAIMKVFPNVDQGASTESILAALNDCVVLGVDAINMSLGSSCGFARESDDDAVNQIYDAIRQVGICLICAASNDYASSYQSENGDTSLATNPDYGTVGSPSSYEASMSVASISGVKTKYLMVNGEQSVYFTEAGNTGSVKKDFAKEMLNGKTSAEFEYVVVPGLGSESNYYDIDVSGKIAVIKRGSLSFEEKITTAQNKGAVGAIVYNNVSGVITMSVGKTTIPSCSVSMDFGKYFEAHTTGTIVIDQSYQAGPFMSEFSSWGPLPNLEFKPDITAHGGDIYSAVRGGYDYFSGTSMASPNMAGATILVRQYVKERFPELSAYEVTELTYQLIMSTATIAYNEEGNPYSPRKQGAGLADIGKSVTTSSYLFVDGTNKVKISLGDDPEKTGVYRLSFNIRNLGATAQSYTINPIVMSESMSSDNKTVSQKAHMFDDTDYEVTVEGNGVSLNGKDSVSLAGYATAKINVTLTLSGQAKAYLDETFVNGMYVEGYIQLLSQNQDVDLNVGFLGFYGDWSVAPMLDVTAYEVGEEQEDSSILADDKLKADIYATLPMGGFRYKISADEYEESYYGMGQFAYKLADGYTEPAILEDKASLTVNMDGSYSLKIIAAGLLRNAKKVTMKICDAVTGEVIWEGVDYDARKSYYTGGRRPGAVMVDFYVNEYNLANNSRYTFSMECELDWTTTQNNLKNTFSFDFYIDNEAPILVNERTQVRVEGTGANKRYILDIYAYDNHYIQGYQLGTFSSINAYGSFADQLTFHNYVIPMADGKRNAENRISYDITQYWEEIQRNNGNIYVELIDYAKNRSSFQLQLPSSLAESIGFSNTMNAVNTRVNEVVDLTDYVKTTPNSLWVKDLKWSTDDEQVAIVRQGVVLGIGVGETTLRVSNYDGSQEAALPVTVREARNDEINVSQIQLNKVSNTIERGEQFTLTATLVPHDLFKDIAPSLFADVHLVWSTSGGVIKFVTYDASGNEMLVDRVEGESSVVVRSLRTGSAMINVIDSNSTSRVNSSCSVRIKNEFTVDGVYLQNYTGRGDENGVVEIPDDLGIVYIYPYAFMNNPYITKIIVPDGVTQIMEAAIYGCDNLKELVLPESCKILDKWSVAWNPNLEKVDLGGVNTIGEMAFIMDSKLHDIDFSGVFSVGPRSFMYCDSLEELDITSIKAMGQMAFAMCSGITSITTGQFTPIGDYGFYNCTGLTEITLNGSAIGDFAFAYCSSLQTVTVNNAVDTIGLGAFYSCSSLSNVYYRSTVRIIGDYAFTNCLFDTVTIPDGVEHIGSLAFGFDNMLTAMMQGYGATEVVVSAGAKLTSLDFNAFAMCNNLKAFTVKEGNAYLSSSNGILYDKAQRKVILVPYGYVDNEITLPSSVTEIGEHAFSMSDVKKVRGDNVTKIGDYAFYSASVQSVNFNNKLTYIGDYAFSNVSGITSWPTCFNNVAYIGNGAFAMSSSNSVLSTFGLSGKIVLPETLTYLGNNAFTNTNISEVVVNSNLTNIGNYTFAQCQNLQYVTLNDSLQNIGDFAFAYCTKLETIEIPNSVTNVGFGAFGFCTSLRSVKLSNNLTAIADFMFANCTALTSIELPESVTVIGEGAFVSYNSTQTSYAMSALTKINLDNVEHIGTDAFNDTQLQEIYAPNLLTVGVRAFANANQRSNYQLSSVYMPNVVSIGNYAFFACNKLETVEIGNAQVIGDYTFYLCNTLVSLDLSNARSIGTLALAGTSKLTSVKLDSIEELGQAVFNGSAVEELCLSANFTSYALQAFYGAKFSKITVDDANSLFFTDSEGALYKNLPNGLLTLVYYPVNNKDENGEFKTEYTALDKTVRVEAYAFANNVHLTQITISERLQTLGAGAFYGCSQLETLNLRCAQAPTLEMIYSQANGGIDNHEYNVFQNSILSTTSTVHINYPSNGSGYDAYNWKLYLKDNLFADGDIARTQNTIDIFDALEALNVNDLTLDDIVQIVLYRRIYSSLSNEQKDFLTDVIGTLAQAEAQLAKIMSAKIDALPQTVTEANRATVEHLRATYNSCNSQIQSQVTNLDKLALAEQQLANTDDDTHIEPNNSWMLPTFVSIGAVAIVACAVALSVVFIKRKKSQTTKEGADNE